MKAPHCQNSYRFFCTQKVRASTVAYGLVGAWDVWDTYLDLFKNPKAYTQNKGTLLGTPNRELQEYSRNIIGIYPPGSLYSLLVLLYSWGSLFGVPIRTLLLKPMPSSGQTFTGLFSWRTGKICVCAATGRRNVLDS